MVTTYRNHMTLNLIENPQETRYIYYIVQYVCTIQYYVYIIVLNMCYFGILINKQIKFVYHPAALLPLYIYMYTYS